MKVEVDSIYIGGGTPTYVDYHYIIELVEILKNFDLSHVKNLQLRQIQIL
ncbi:MAG: hypothetical protein ACLTA5_07500 [Anaerococcus obesiensis]